MSKSCKQLFSPEPATQAQTPPVEKVKVTPSPRSANTDEVIAYDFAWRNPTTVSKVSCSIKGFIN
jgi:hypothetical protein